jgi:hypothetical protein
MMATTNGRPGPTRLSNVTVGAVGTYLVAAELVRRGYIVSALSQTAKGIDILAADRQTLRPLAVQVKCSQRQPGRAWLMTRTHEQVRADGLFYIFVHLPRTNTAAPEFFVVPSRVVAAYVARSHRDWLRKPGRKGQQRRDSALRVFRDLEGRFLNRWDLLKASARNPTRRA